MKSIFAAVGALVLVGVVALAGFIGYEYKHGPQLLAKEEAEAIDMLLRKQQASPRETMALRRIQNSVVMHASIAGTMVTTAVLAFLQEDHVLTEAQLKAMEDAARMLEKQNLTLKDAQAFLDSHKDALPHVQRPKAPRR